MSDCEYAPDDCDRLFNCCDCGSEDGTWCGCGYCFSCNACDVCSPSTIQCVCGEWCNPDESAYCECGLYLPAN